MVDRKALEEFLRANGCKNPAEAMAVLEPFFKKAEAGKYDLALANEELKPKIAEAVVLATGRKVNKTIFISRQNPFPRPEWMTEAAYQESWNSLGDSLGASLGDSLWASLGDSLWASLWDSFGASLRASLRDSIWNSLGASIWASLGNSLGASLWNSLWDSLFYYAGFTLVNNQEQADKLKPLLEIMADYLVLGFKKDEPETLLVLCA